jgi:hypothetical protein
MAKTKISEYSATSANNTDISNINIAEGCSPANVNNAIRTVMAQLKDLQAGTSGDTIPVTAGGTGSATASDARTALSAAKLGANSDITSITGLTTPLTTAQGGTGTASTTFASLTTNVTGTLPVANGGTGLATLTANNVLLGNGTSAPSFVAPSTSGNLLTSNGTTWASTAPVTGIGSGQSWTNVRTSPGRSTGTTYTNSTGKPIEVMVVINASAAGTGSTTSTVVVNGVTIGSAVASESSGFYNIPTTWSFIVPDTHTYSVTLSTTATVTYTWAELR